MSTSSRDFPIADRELLLAIGRVAMNAGTLELCVRALINGLVAEDSRIGTQLTQDMNIARVIEHCRALAAIRLADHPDLAARITTWLQDTKGASVKRNSYLHGSWTQLFDKARIPSKTEATVSLLRRGQMQHSVVSVDAVHTLADQMGDLIEQAFALVIRITATFGPDPEGSSREQILASLDALETSSE